MTNEQRQARITALLRERVGYEARGDKARVQAVDAELAAYGHEGKTPAQRSTKRPAPTARKAEKR